MNTTFNQETWSALGSCTRSTFPWTTTALRGCLAFLLSHKVKKVGGSDSDFRTTSHGERFDQNELSDLIRDLNLSKDSSKLLASRLKEKNVLQPGKKITFYRRREKDLLSFFTKENNLVFCSDIGNLLKKTGLSEYNPSDWRLFIDSSKRTLFLFQLDTLFYFPYIFLQFSSYNFLYMFRTGWSIIRRIKLHVQPLVPFPRSLLSRAWPLVLTKCT